MPKGCKQGAQTMPKRIKSNGKKNPKQNQEHPQTLCLSGVSKKRFIVEAIVLKVLQVGARMGSSSYQINNETKIRTEIDENSMQGLCSK